MLYSFSYRHFRNSFYFYLVSQRLHQLINLIPFFFALFFLLSSFSELLLY
nr:MAG TPA: hypothetical protein [Bacteriophage sp.]